MDGFVVSIGTLWTASAHIITAVIGSGVLSLAWSMAKLGWVIGPSALLLFALITFYTSLLLADCYRCGTNRNYTYMDAVRSYLGGYLYHFPSMVHLHAQTSTHYNISFSKQNTAYTHLHVMIGIVNSLTQAFISSTMPMAC
mgnify:FL=1